MNVDRSVGVLRRGKDPGEKPVQGTPEDRVHLVWELTKEAWSLSGETDVESGLRRDVVHLFRKGRAVPIGRRVRHAAHGYPRTTGDIDLTY